MHSGQPIPSHSTTSLRPPSSMESSPHHSNPLSSLNMVELHSSIPHLQSINDEHVSNIYTHNSHKHSHHNHKSKHHKLKFKSKPKYNTLTKPNNLSHQTTNSSSSSSNINNTNNINNNSSPDTPPIHPLQCDNSNNSNDSQSRINNQFEPGYKRWKGQNSIFCNGRIIAGPETKKQIRTLFIIFIPVTIYFSTTAVILWRDYSMEYAVIIPIFIFIFAVIFFFIVSCIDPGIIPRPEIYEKSSTSTDVINYISRHKHIDNEISKQTFQPPWEQQINIDGNIRIIKYCYTCHHFRPPRSFHCNNCDCCIERFDHHCPWLGNCIAKRNYHFYIAFLICINSLCLWVGWTSLYIILSVSNTEYINYSTTDIFISLWKYNTWPMITISLSIFSIFFPMVLLTFHCYLIATGQTTNEKAKNSFEFVSPYSRGCWGNISEIFCVVNVPISNVHIHHTPPNKLNNEAIVNKKKIVYINSIDTKKSITSTTHAHNNHYTKEQQKLLKNGIKIVNNNQIVEEEEEINNDSSMDNNDPTPTKKQQRVIDRYNRDINMDNNSDHSHDTTISGSGSNSGSETASDSGSQSPYYSHHKHLNIPVRQHTHPYPQHQSSHHHNNHTSHHHKNIGSNSSMEYNITHINNNTYNSVTSKLKRKRGPANNNEIHYNKVHRSQSGYIQAQYHNKKHKNKHTNNNNNNKYSQQTNTKYMYGYMDAISNPSLNHIQTAPQSHGQSIKSEQIYYNGNGNKHDQSHTINGYHPAYYRMQNAHKKRYKNDNNNQEFAFSPLSPVNSKGGVPYYPSPQNINAPVYHDHSGHQQTPILSLNEDNNTLTSTYSQHIKHHKKHRQNTGGSTKSTNIHTHYKGPTTNSTLFTPDIGTTSSDNDNDNSNDHSSSDYYANISGPSHAYTYHPTIINNNAYTHIHIRPPPPSNHSVHKKYNNNTNNNNNRSNSQHYNRHNNRHDNRHKYKHTDENDILQYSNENRYDINRNKYNRKYNHINGRHKRID